MKLQFRERREQKEHEEHPIDVLRQAYQLYIDELNGEIKWYQRSDDVMSIGMDVVQDYLFTFAGYEASMMIADKMDEEAKKEINKIWGFREVWEYDYSQWLEKQERKEEKKKGSKK